VDSSTGPLGIDERDARKQKPLDRRRQRSVDEDRRRLGAEAVGVAPGLAIGQAFGWRNPGGEVHDRVHLGNGDRNRSRVGEVELGPARGIDGVPGVAQQGNRGTAQDA
jgi:hypothetical protein